MAGAPTIVLDCRWLGIGGAGRTTELVLRGLAECDADAGTESPVRWILWGDGAALAPLAWPGTEISEIAADPRLLLGQRHAFAVPAGDLVVFLHQQRPLRPLPSVSFIYDTIPLRHGSSPPVRALKKLFLRRVARISRHILTISEHSKRCVVGDLGVPPESVTVVRFPFDDGFVERVLVERRATSRVDAALFVGAFLPHKNLPRLLSAFGATEFCRQGGRLVLAGGTPAQAQRLVAGLDSSQGAFVSVRPACSQAEIEHLFATSLFLVQPSIEEGFGLPAWEAMCCGLPICVSDGGALPDVTAGHADPFPATSVPAMVAAIDRCAARARDVDEAWSLEQSAGLRARAPSIRQFGLEVRSVLTQRATTRTSLGWSR